MRVVSLGRTSRRRPWAVVAVIPVLAWAPLGAGQASSAAPPYFPPAGSWANRAPADLGLDAANLQTAIAFAVAHENPGDKDLGVGNSSSSTPGRAPGRLSRS